VPQSDPRAQNGHNELRLKALSLINQPRFRVKDILKFSSTLFSLSHGRLQRKYKLLFSPHYWIVLQYWQKIQFWAGKNIFGAKNWLRSRHESASILRSIFWAVSGQVLLAFFLIAGLEFLERLLVSHLGKFVVIPLAQLDLDIQANATFLSTLAQVAGVFLGLYFTAVSIIASTIYARVQADIRGLLMREKIGNLYIKVVALLGAMTLILLAQSTLGFQPAILNLFLVTILGVVSVFSFVILGMRAFNFFDPTVLADYLYQDLVRWFRQVTPDGFQWQDPSFQAHYQRNAEESLTTFSDIVFLAASEEHIKGKTLNDLAAKLLGLLQFYENEKLRIPSDSFWFKRAHEHKDWLTTSYSEVDIRLQTGTALEPKVVPDMLWVETMVEEDLCHLMNTHLARNDVQNAVALADRFQDALGTIGNRLAIHESLHLFRKLKPILFEQTRKTELEVEGSEERARQLGLALALTDINGMALISILLGCSRRLEAIAAQSFGAVVAKIAWRRPEAVYETSLPRRVIESLEELYKKLDFERQVEGHTVSPLWYQQQLAALGFVRFLADIINKLAGELESTFSEKAEALISEQRYIFAAQLVQRGLEASHKFSFHIGQARECFDSFEALRRVSDIPWPSVDWDSITKRVDEVHERLVVAFGRLVPHLPLQNESKHWPDYFGQAYAVLAQESYLALAAGNDAKFKQIFPSFFFACLSAFNRLQGSLKEYEDKTRIIFSTEPIADVLALSGLALLQTELDQKSYWRVTKALWDKHFALHPNPQAFGKAIIAILEYRQSLLLQIPPREIARTSWSQDLAGRLRSLGLGDDIYLQGRTDNETKHRSPIIRTVSRQGRLFIHPEDVFTVTYLMSRPEMSEIKLSPRAQSFADSLARDRHEVVERATAMPAGTQAGIVRPEAREPEIDLPDSTRLKGRGDETEKT